MSGHSKWSTIKRKKGAEDKKRGQLFTKLSRAIIVAAREGGADPDTNAALAAAVAKARSYSMPKDNIERAIQRGAGAGEGSDAYEAIVYEGYGPDGVAIIVEALSDNRNRTGAEIRHAFDRHGGGLGEPNSVAWNFEKRGVILVDGGRYDEDDLIVAIDAGAEDVVDDDGTFRILTAPGELAAVRAALDEAGVEIVSSDIAMDPKNTVAVEEGQAKTLLNLIEALEEHDDVDAVHANFDISEEVMERALA